MKIIILLTVLTIAVNGIEYYTTDNDHYDVDSLIHNVSDLQRYLNCYKDAGPCSKLANSYKKNLKEAVKEACKRCNTDQKHMFGRFLLVVKQVLPEEYVAFRKKYDPEDKYFDALEEEIYKYI